MVTLSFQYVRPAPPKLLKSSGLAIAGSESANGGALSFVTFTERHLELEATAQGSLGDSPDFFEGVAAFREKRPAKFQAR